MFPDSAWHAAKDDDSVPFPIPCADFRVHRLPVSGLVVRLDVLGPAIAPSATFPVHAVSLLGLRQSEIGNGTLKSLATCFKS